MKSATCIGITECEGRIVECVWAILEHGSRVSEFGSRELRDLQLIAHSVENPEDVGEQLRDFSARITPRLKKMPGGENAAKTENDESRSTVTRRLFLPGDKGISIFRVPCPVILSFSAGRSRSAYRVVNLRCGSCGQSGGGMLIRFDRPDRALKQLHDDVNHLVDVEVFRQRNEDVLWQLVGEEFDVVELQLRRRFRC